MKLFFFNLIFLTASIGSVHAQTIKGKVFGESESGKEILPGASVNWLNRSMIVLANDNGVFEISTQDVNDKRLIISIAGFITDTFSVNEKTYVSIILKSANNMLGGITVSGRSATSSAAKTEVIGQKEITKSACCDMAGCFETQATVQPQTTNVITNSKELRILGLSGVYNQLLIDGMPLIMGITYNYGITGYPGTLIDNIFVSKGANSVLQGYESISGQINLIPKQPDKTDKFFANIYMNNF